MKNLLSVDVLKLPQERPLRAAVLTLDHHVMTRLTGKIRNNENYLTFPKRGCTESSLICRAKARFPRSGTFLIRMRGEKSMCPWSPNIKISLANGLTVAQPHEGFLH
jgi:hypothetical protein